MRDAGKWDRPGRLGIQGCRGVVALLQVLRQVKDRHGFEVAYHGARERPFRAGMQSYSSCATGRETAREAGHALHL